MITIGFLNKACIIRNPQENVTPDGKASDPWSLCTVNQVGELKALIKEIPIWFTGILMTLMINQSSFPVIRATSMDRHIASNVEIPAGSFSIFSMISWVAIYHRIYNPPSLIENQRQTGPPEFERKNGGGTLFLLRFHVDSSNSGEHSQRNKDFRTARELWWTCRLYCGIVEGFCVIAQIEFFYSELPKSMSSVASCLFMLGMCVGDLVASFIMTNVDEITKRGGLESWVSTLWQYK